MSTATAAVMLLAVWVGAALGHVAWDLVDRRWLATGTVSVVVGVAGVVIASRTRRPLAEARNLLAIAVAALLVSSLGAVTRATIVHQGPAATLGQTSRSAVVDVVAVTDPRMTDTGSRWVIARLHHVYTPGDRDPIRSRERVLLRPPAHARIELGGRYRAVGVIRRLEGDLADGMARQGVAAGMDVSELQMLRAPPAWLAATTTLRERVRQAAAERLPVAESSLLTGLVTGDLTGQPEAVEEQVMEAGLSHLVAVSGSNVGVVVLATVGMVVLTTGHRRAAWWAALVVVWWFVVLVRVEPSVLRAAATATLVLGAMLAGRLRSAPQLLCTAGMLALLIDPVLAVRLGFILSMVATAGVLVGLGPLDRLMAAHVPLLPGALRRVLAATCGAQVAVAPVLLLSGGTVHPASLPANLMAVPAAGVAGAVGGVAAMIAVVSPSVAGLVAVVARPALAVVLASARVFSSAQGQRAAVTAVLLLASWLVARAAARRIGVAPSLVATATAGVVGILAWGGPPWVGDGLPDAPVLIVLDVGQGDAVLIGDPVAGWMLVDAGPRDGDVISRLRDHGVTRLASVVLTHPHEDHVGGLGDVLAAVDVDALVIGPEDAVGLPSGGPDPPVVPVASGSVWQHGGIRVEVLSPPPTGLGDDANENSLVLRLQTAAGRSVLLTGDAEVVAQTRLLADPRIDVDLLKVPHHGGATNAEGFLAATTPEVAVISAGRGNPFGHPHPDVLVDLAGVDVRRTDVQGDVIVPLGPG